MVSFVQSVYTPHTKMPSFPQRSPRSLQLCLEAEVCCQRLSQTLGTAQHMSYLLHQTWFLMARESHHSLQGKDAFAFPNQCSSQSCSGREKTFSMLPQLILPFSASAILPFCTVRPAACRQCMGPCLPHSTKPLRTEVVPRKGRGMKSLLSSKPAAPLWVAWKVMGYRGAFQWDFYECASLAFINFNLLQGTLATVFSISLQYVFIHD